MQSIKRAIKRGLAIIVYDEVTHRREIVWRKSATKSQWDNAKKSKLSNEQSK